MSAKPRVLDLFCGAGGASAGYRRVGFEVVGVDVDPQPRYPWEFHQANAMVVLRRPALLASFDLIHASPPCQPYSPAVRSRSSPWVPTRGKDEPAMIAAVHRALLASGRPWVIENVAGAAEHMPAGYVLLCGAMFARPIPRHRLFATSWGMAQPAHPDCRGLAKDSAEWLRWEYRDMSVTGKGRREGTRDRWAHLLGLDLSHRMSQHEMAEAIPPAYTEHVGRSALRALPCLLTGDQPPPPLPER